MKSRIESSPDRAATGVESRSASAAGWRGAAAQSPPLHVITLVSSTAPVPLQAPKAPELAGLAVFRSRRLEDGRERFRLHIGYFPSADAAERVLPVVRKTYPAAFVSLAPQTNLGSLEDTAVARFSILRPIETDAASEPTPETVQRAPAPPRSRPVLRTADVVVAPPAPAPAAPSATTAPNISLKPAQRYAVQLVWTKEPIDLAKLPTLAIFGGYLLYAVETAPDGRRMYGVRLGFYEDALSARLVAQYVRSEFKGVAVVPVSEREIARASSAAIRLSASRTARGTTTSRVRWPQTALTVEFAPARSAAPASV